MKPFHAGLLMIAAALAGGLMVKLTEGPTQPTLVAAVQTPVKIPEAVAQQPAEPEPAKPSPVVAKEAVQALPTAPAAPVQVERPNKRGPIARTKPIDGGPLPYQPPAAVVAPPAAPEPQVAVVAPRQEPEPAQLAEAVPPSRSDPPAPAQPEPAGARPIEAAPPRQVMLPTGTSIAIRVDEMLSSDRKSPGDAFYASLAEPVIADGLVIAERGARVTGRVTDVRRARLSGTSMLQLELSSITTADGQRVGVYSEPWSKFGEGAARGDAEKIGGGAALGAIIGAIAGGGKGAAIGAGAGGAAGTGAAAITGTRAVNVPPETVIRFRLASSVTITERQF